VKETDLDWIFIRPSHHGRGAGRFLIQQIVNRSADRSNVIRVGGTVEFYKRCGFYNKRLWVWATRQGYCFTAPAVQP
jgi:GNAT superfamily N-acetyltransferase